MQKRKVGVLNQHGMLPPPHGHENHDTSGEALLESAFIYLNSVKEAFAHDSVVYRSFTTLLREFKDSAVGIDVVVRRVAHLFSNHRPLLEGFRIFLPSPYAQIALVHGLMALSDPVLCAAIEKSVQMGGSASDNWKGSILDMDQADNDPRPPTLAITPALSARLSTNCTAYALHKLELLPLLSASTAERDAVAALYAEEFDSARKRRALAVRKARKETHSQRAETGLVAILETAVEGSLAYHVAHRIPPTMSLHATAPPPSSRVMAASSRRSGSAAAAAASPQTADTLASQQDAAQSSFQRRQKLFSRLFFLEDERRRRLLRACTQLVQPSITAARQMLAAMRDRCEREGQADQYERLVELVLMFHRGELGPVSLYHKLLSLSLFRNPPILESAPPSASARGSLSAFFPGISSASLKRTCTEYSKGFTMDPSSLPAASSGPSYRRAPRHSRRDFALHSAKHYRPIAKQAINGIMVCRAPANHPRGEGSSGTGRLRDHEYIDALSRVDTLLCCCSAIRRSRAEGVPWDDMPKERIPRSLAKVSNGGEDYLNRNNGVASAYPSPLTVPSPCPLFGTAAMSIEPFSLGAPAILGADPSAHDGPIAPWWLSTIVIENETEMERVETMLHTVRAELIAAGPEGFAPVMIRWAAQEPDLFVSHFKWLNAEVELREEKGLPGASVYEVANEFARKEEEKLEKTKHKEHVAVLVAPAASSNKVEAETV